MEVAGMEAAGAGARGRHGAIKITLLRLRSDRSHRGLTQSGRKTVLIALLGLEFNDAEQAVTQPGIALGDQAGELILATDISGMTL